MHKSNSRIKVWRNTIHLFHQYEKPKFVGPFKATGFTYKIEPLFLNSKNGNNIEPDIVASSKNGWLILELTYNKKSKEHNLHRYKSIDPRDLGNYGLREHIVEGDIITSRLSFIDDGPFCQIIVNDTLEVIKENHLLNGELMEALRKANGADLRKLPEIPISLLPEMKNQKEIRKGLIHIVMQIFSPVCKGKTVVEIVDEGLDRISKDIRVSARQGLITRVTAAMEDLRTRYLQDYLEKENDVYKATKKFTIHHKTIEHISSQLKIWAGTQQTIIPDHTKDFEHED